jgi:hypothetical protein
VSQSAVFKQRSRCFFFAGKKTQNCRGCDMYLAAVYLWVWRPTDAPRARRYSRTPLTLTSGVCLRVRVGGISDVFGGGRRVRAVT